MAIHKSPRIEWNTPKRARFRALIESAGWSQHRAAAAVEVPRSIAMKWLRKDTDRRTGINRPGRPSLISDETLEAIDKWFCGYYNHRIMTLDEIIEHFDLKCSIYTLLRKLSQIGYHLHIPETKEFLSAKQKELRLQFATKYLRRRKYFWRHGIYADESTFNTQMMRRLRIWRKRGERYRLDCIQFTFHSGRASFMAWAAIGYNFKSNLKILTNEKDAKGFNQKAYEHQILRGELADIAKTKRMGKGYSDFFCVEDNSRAHGKKGTKQNGNLCNKARIECFIYSIDWPPKSPDLNPIENVWRVLKQLLRNRKPHGGWGIAKLKEAVIDIWDNEIMPDIYNKWIDEMPLCLQAVLDNEGAMTQY